MKLCNLLLISAALPLLGACVVAGDPYGAPGYAEPAYYGNAYPTSTYIEYNQSYSHRGGYRENYWAHDRSREEQFHNAPRAEHAAAVHEEHHDDHHDDHGDHPYSHR